MQRSSLKQERPPEALLVACHSQETIENDSFSFGNDRPGKEPYGVSSRVLVVSPAAFKEAQRKPFLRCSDGLQTLHSGLLCFQVYLQKLATSQLKQFCSFCSSCEQGTRVTRFIFPMTESNWKMEQALSTFRNIHSSFRKGLNRAILSSYFYMGSQQY